MRYMGPSIFYECWVRPSNSVRIQYHTTAHAPYSAVSLPQMVASSHMDAESVALVRDYANELMVYVRTCTAAILCILTSSIIKIHDEGATSDIHP